MFLKFIVLFSNRVLIVLIREAQPNIERVFTSDNRLCVTCITLVCSEAQFLIFML